ncbi:COG1470 family protein [Sphingobacterium litopenaei]|uniref:COG1470 family protein n=1 Tax=Sphingobacterium litopenaei TaxID=2763500 RepID=UPI001CC1E6BE|nr:NEW3 domain-containing protein [Sphingobacterium litopenaei]
MNVEAPTNETFRYNSLLTNGKSETVDYKLSTKLPAGWQVTYRVEGISVTSLQVESGSTKDISIEITCPITTKPDTYKIPVQAISSFDTLKLDLEAVVRGSYAVELTTPTGRLSDEIVAGNSKEILLVVKNTGTLPLNALELSSQLPSKWETSFSPSNIEQLQPGQSADIKVTLKVPEKTIAGDYVTKMTVRSNNGTSEATIRMMVKTSILSGWVGIVIIAAAAGLIYYLIRKYGRR